MVGTFDLIWQRAQRWAMAAVLAITVLLPQTTLVASAASGDRTLYLYYTHTKETGRFTFRKNGQYDQKVLAQLNYFLRDWRRNEPAKMDPRLFDLIWEVYQEVGASEPINIVSAYRSPATNAMLRAKSSGVAENSQHMKGHAMDFFIPGIPLPKLRATAMRKQVGGVGFYPTSGSPFVHLDTGSVRAWPRMTRAQLKDVFPDGRTLHLPTDGKPLSDKGRLYAQAEWQKCHQVPCGGTGAKGGKTIFDIFSGGSDEPAPVTMVADTGPAQRSVTSVPVMAPIPANRPADLGAPAQVQLASLPQQDEVIPFSSQGSAPLTDAELADAPAVLVAPVPAIKSARLMMATAHQGLPENNEAVLAIASLEAPVPAPRIHMTQKDPVADIVTAYAPAAPDPGAQKALDMLISQQVTAALPKGKPTITANVQTASLAPSGGLEAFGDIFASVAKPKAAPVAQQQAAIKAPVFRPGIDMRPTELVAPDLDHVDEVLIEPASVASAQFAVLFDHDEADFNPATELGGFIGALDFGTPDGLSSTQFISMRPLLVANR